MDYFYKYTKTLKIYVILLKITFAMYVVVNIDLLAHESI